MAALFCGFAGLGMIFPVAAPTVPVPAEDDTLDLVEQVPSDDRITEPRLASKSLPTTRPQSDPSRN